MAGERGIPGPAIPEWEPLWQFSGDITHVRVLAGRLGGIPAYTCPELQAKKARPSVYPVRERAKSFAPQPQFADMAIGLVRSVIVEHVTRSVAPTAESIEQAALRAAAPRELAPGTALVVQAGVNGYRQVLQRLRSSGDLAADAVLVTDMVVAEPQVGGGVTEWSAWALHWIGRDGVRETHLMCWRDAGSRPLDRARLGVIARSAAEGFRAEPISSWSSRFEPAAAQPPATERLRIRQVGVIDSSDALLFDGTAAQARALFDDAVPGALPVLAGGGHVPGRGCVSCAIRPECQGLALVPGVLGVAGRAEYTRALSTSDLWTHWLCPERLHLQSDLGLPREPVETFEGARRGILVHQWLEAAHARGVPCDRSELPSADDPGVLGAQLGWTTADAVLVADYLAGHPDQCPVTGASGEVVRPECAITVHDTDADVIASTRPDLVIARTSADRGRQFLIRETKTLNLHRLPDDPEIALVHHFPQVAAAVCLLAAGVNPLDPTETIDPENGLVELELLGVDGATVVGFAIDDPDVVLAARVALADRVDRWLHDDLHSPRPGRHCDTCPVRSWCPVMVLSDSGVDVNPVPPGPSSVPGGEIPRDVLALIEADTGAVDDDFPF